MRTLRASLLRLLAVATLVSLALAMDADSHRLESLAARLHCTCGCGEILQECSHPKCEIRGSLKHELADAIQQGQTDDQILELMGARHAATILQTPPFKGFNTMLWIVPIVICLFALAFVLFGRLRSGRRDIDKTQ
jgi:cytochrome c-type biogenesis protein CcmH/NrfF